MKRLLALLLLFVLLLTQAGGLAMAAGSAACEVAASVSHSCCKSAKPCCQVEPAEEAGSKLPALPVGMEKRGLEQPAAIAIAEIVLPEGPVQLRTGEALRAQHGAFQPVLVRRTVLHCSFLI